MATIAAPATRPLVSRFYVTMAVIFVAIAFGGFFETYWLQLARGTFVKASPLVLTNQSMAWSRVQCIA